MKKRIAAAALAAVLVCGIIGLRPKAVGGTVAAIGSIGIAAYYLMMTLIDNSDALGNVIEDNIEFFSSPDSPWNKGWNYINHQLQSWFDSGEITISADGKVDLTYDQYMQLYHQMIKSVGKPSLEFESAYKCGFFSADLSQPILVGDLPHISEFFNTQFGQSFTAVWYNDDCIVFPLFCTIINSFEVNNTRFSYWMNRQVTNSFQLGATPNGDTARGGGGEFDDLVRKYAPSVYMPSPSMFQYSFEYYGNHSFKFEPTSCFLYKNGSLTYTSLSDIDVSEMVSGLISTTGKYDDFLKSIDGFSVSSTAPLDDLSDVLPLDKTKNPTLEVDTDPSIVNPDDAITVKDVPGNPEMTLTEYKAQLKLDIDIPSIISTKFPFCIPYDLIRILGVFVADPVAPVFRIPISTDPAQLEPFKGNQTIGNIPEDFEPMFEIDEELIIDLSVVPLVQPICYTVFIVGFIVLLIHITPKMINH